jgi:hypothetical protein
MSAKVSIVPQLSCQTRTKPCLSGVKASPRSGRMNRQEPTMLMFNVGLILINMVRGR